MLLGKVSAVWSLVSPISFTSVGFFYISALGMHMMTVSVLLEPGGSARVMEWKASEQETVTTAQ